MIKFRGVNIFGNEWLYGNLVKIEENRYSILPEINDMPTCKCIAVSYTHLTLPTILLV